MTEKDTAKISHLLGAIQEHVKSGLYLDTRHAQDRRSERNISRLEILYVLKHGYHEKKGIVMKNYFTRGVIPFEAKI